MGDPKPTTMTLQLADRSIKHPVGILEDVPIKVGKLFIPVDFVVLEMKEDVQIPIILGRPFLATAGAVIDVKKGRLTLEVGDEKVVFNLFAATKFSSQEESCLQIDVISQAAAGEHAKIQATYSKACSKQGETDHYESFMIQAITPKAQWRKRKVEDVPRSKGKRKKKRITHQLNLYPGRRKQINHNWGEDTRNLHPP